MAGLLAVRYYALKGIRSVRNAKADFPEAKTLLEKGYKVGRRPKRLPKNFFSSDKKVDKQASNSKNFH